VLAGVKRRVAGFRHLCPENVEGHLSDQLHPLAPRHLPGFDAVGLVHAMLLRTKALLLPIKTLVLSGH
jgi:hypothetical protein